MSQPAENLRRIVTAIWSTQLGLDLEDSEAEPLEELLGDDAVVCAVQLRGGFNGVLIARCSRSLSVYAAAAAFAASGQELGATDVRDAISELTHMTAGNLKALLAARTSASLPHPLEDDEQPGVVAAEAGFTLDGEPLIVTLRRMDD